MIVVGFPARTESAVSKVAGWDLDDQILFHGTASLSFGDFAWRKSAQLVFLPKFDAPAFQFLN